MTRRWARRGPVVLASLAAGAGAGGAATGTWVVATDVQAAVGADRVAVHGAQAAPLVPALALVALAAAAALGVARRRGALLVGVLLVATGAGLVVVAVRTLADPAAAAAAAVAEVTGVGGGSFSATATGWPLPAVAGGLVLVAAGVATVAARGSWSTTSRYDTARGGTPPTRSDRAGDWDALSSGTDPTDPDGRSRP